jgi:hypothetical protein
MPRYFTLGQAHSLLPRVKTLLDQAVQAKAQYERAEARTQEVVRRVMTLGGILVDRAVFQLNRDLQERSGERLKSNVEEIHGMGVLIKDLDIGLVDFPTLLNGVEVYLCWRIGEDAIEWWHGVSDGFAGRQAIDQEFIRNHAGEDPD